MPLPDARKLIKLPKTLWVNPAASMLRYIRFKYFPSALK